MNRTIEIATYIAFITIPFLIVFLFAWSCERNRWIPDVSFLTADAYFRIAGQDVTVPMVALNRPDHVFSLGHRKPAKSRKEILTEQATDPYNPMVVNSVTLLIRKYQKLDTYGAPRKICPPLTRQWAQMVCRGERRGVLWHLPKRILLLSRSSLDILKHHHMPNSGTKYDQVEHMMFNLGRTEVGCSQASKFCTAAVETMPGLIAVWTVWSSDDESAEDMAERQGAAIIEFVRRALGPVEDRTLLSES